MSTQDAEIAAGQRHDDDEVIGTTRDDAHRAIDPVGAALARRP